MTSKPEIVTGPAHSLLVAALHRREVPNQEGEFAMRLIAELGKAAFDYAGEDSAGRAKGRRMTPHELVKYCCDVSQETFDEFTSRGWMIDLPSYEEIREKDREERGRN